MVKRIVILAGLMGVLALGVVAFASDKPEAENQLTLTITSADPDQEVEIEGAFVIDSDAQTYHSISQKTPYEFKTSSLLLSGVFHCLSADSRIKVEISLAKPVKSGMSAGSGIGTVIIIGRGLGEHVNDHIQTLR